MPEVPPQKEPENENAEPTVLGITYREFIFLDITNGLKSTARDYFFRMYNISDVLENLISSLKSKGCCKWNGAITSLGESKLADIKEMAGISALSNLYRNRNSYKEKILPLFYHKKESDNPSEILPKEPEQITGGIADGKTIREVAARHGRDEGFMKEQLENGITVELEHTNDHSKAEEIAIDHLWENPDYYIKLATIEDTVADKPKINYDVPKVNEYEVLESGIISFRDKATALKILNENGLISYAVSWVGGSYTEVTLGIKLDGGWYAMRPRQGKGNLLPMQPLRDVDLNSISDTEQKETDASNPDLTAPAEAKNIPGNTKKTQQDLTNEQIKKILNLKGANRHLYTLEDFHLIAQYTGDSKTQDETSDGYLYDFYTPDEVVKTCWQLAYKYGFRPIEGAKILEPSCGVGRFIRYAPEYCTVVAYEMDETSALIAKLLYPKFNIINDLFESSFYVKTGLKSFNYKAIIDSYNLVMGNPPYLYPYRSIYREKETAIYPFIMSTEQLFLMRGVDSLSKGGLLIYVIPATIVNNEKTYLQFKTELSKKCNMLDLYRLPSGTFKNTQITTDIIVLQKK